MAFLTSRQKFFAYVYFAVLALAIGVVALVIILGGYSVTWTGFGTYTLPNGTIEREKNLWDWMESLIIPLVLAVGTYFFKI